MDRGRILLEGTPDSLVASEVGHQVVEIRHADEGVLAEVESRDWPRDVVEDRVYLYDDEAGVAAAPPQVKYHRT